MAKHSENGVPNNNIALINGALSILDNYRHKSRECELFIILNFLVPVVE